MLDPSLKGLVQFTRGHSDESKMHLRLRALEVRKEDLVYVAEKYLMAAIEQDKTSRVTFGSQQANTSELEQNGWNVFNPIEFLSYRYFDKWNDQNK